jgi:hypothetical protein
MNKDVSIQLHAPVTLSPVLVAYEAGWVNVDVAVNTEVSTSTGKMNLAFRSAARQFPHAVNTASVSKIQFNNVFSFTL